MDSQFLINCCEKAFSQAKTPDYNILSECVMKCPGYTGNLIRRFKNNLLKNIASKARYLEIGVYKGATAVAALYNNTPEKYWLIDNWSEFGGPKDEFFENFETATGKKPNIIEENSFKLKLDTTDIKDVNVYFYDGDHSAQSQAMALEYYYSVMDDTFVFLVDDWHWNGPRLGTEAGIEKCNLKVLYKHEEFIPNKELGELVDIKNTETWWNGYCAYVLQK
jgi:hypothetical protein